MEKVYRRMWWSAQFSRLWSDRPDCELWPSVGCRRVIVRESDGRTVRDFRLPEAVLSAMPGERYCCLGPAPDDAVAIEVVRAAAGEIRALLLGDLEIDTGYVQLALLCERDMPVIARAQAKRHAAASFGVVPPREPS